MNPIKIQDVLAITEINLTDKYKIQYSTDTIQQDALYLVIENANLPFGISKYTNTDSDIDYYSVKINLNDEEYLAIKLIDEQIQNITKLPDEYTYKTLLITSDYEDKKYYSVNAKFVIHNAKAFNTKRVGLDVDDFRKKYPKRIRGDLLLSFGYSKNEIDKTIGYRLYVNQLKARRDNTECMF